MKRMPEPFLKWPGGKRWLADKLEGLLPASYERYIEPFLGGGAVFFHLAPRKAILSDSNGELINAYRCIRDHAEEIDRRLALLQKRHSAALYYRIRKTLPGDTIERAVRFIYLNRTCFNGIYRVNLRGQFNVPVGTKDLVEYPQGYLEAIANTLQGVRLKESDFEKAIDRAAVGDFVYVDPPYTVMHNNNNFVKYNSNLFSWKDQVRLAGAIKRATERGAAVMLSNANHKSVRSLYKGFGHHLKVSRASVLAAHACHRRQTTELVVISYPPETERLTRT